MEVLGGYQRQSGSNVLPYFLEERETSPVSSSFQSSWATWLTWTLDSCWGDQMQTVFAENGASFPVPHVPGQIPGPNQDIVSKEEAGEKPEWELTVATTVPKVPAQPVLLLLGDLTHSHHFRSLFAS